MNEKHCLGCGVLLQDQNVLQEGYTTSLENDICQRCFRMRNYGEYQIVTKSNEEYLNILKNVSETKDVVLEEQPQTEEEQPDAEEYQPTEEELQQEAEMKAKMKAQYDEILDIQKKYKVELPKEVEDLVKQREEFFKNNDMEALIKKMQGYVNPESDKLLITWIVTRFPQLFKRLSEEEQKALIRHYNLSI